MLRLRDIMTTEVITVTPEATLREAAELLAGRHLGGMPVMDGQSVAGVVSATDLLTFDASRPPVPLLPDDEVDWGDALERSADEEAELEQLPSGSYFTGFWGDAGPEVLTRMDSPEGPEWNVLDEHTVAEVMTHAVHHLPPDAPVDAAADMMRRLAVHRVLVMEGDRLRGIVSTMDIARAVADHRLQTRTFVFGP